MWRHSLRRGDPSFVRMTSGGGSAPVGMTDDRHSELVEESLVALPHLPERNPHGDGNDRGPSTPSVGTTGLFDQLAGGGVGGGEPPFLAAGGGDVFGPAEVDGWEEVGGEEGSDLARATNPAGALLELGFALVELAGLGEQIENGGGDGLRAGSHERDSHSKRPGWEQVLLARPGSGWA